MMRRWVPPLLLLPTLALMAATRLPRDDGWGVAFGVGAAAVLILAGFLLRATPPRAVRLLLSFGVLGLFLIPPIRQAWVPELPGPLPPVVALLFLLALHPRPQGRAPGARQASLATWFIRTLPLSLPLLGLLGAALILQALPSRLADLHELAGAGLPIAAGVLVMVPILAWAWLRDAMAPPQPQAPPEEASP